jgi:hypothetical protein
MEPQGSLPCSQEPATGPCPEADESSPHLPTLSSKIYFNNYCPPIYAYIFRVVSSLQVFRPKFFMHFSTHPCVPQDPPSDLP